MTQRYIVVEGKKGEGCLVEDDVIGNLMAYGGLWEYFLQKVKLSQAQVRQN
jgi:hypothetical protein